MSQPLAPYSGRVLPLVFEGGLRILSILLRWSLRVMACRPQGESVGQSEATNSGYGPTTRSLVKLTPHMSLLILRLCKAGRLLCRVFRNLRSVKYSSPLTQLSGIRSIHMRSRGRGHRCRGSRFNSQRRPDASRSVGRWCRCLLPSFGRSTI